MPATLSNEVITPVSAVEGVKVGQGPNNNATGTPTGVSDTTTGVLPHTGNSLPVGWLLGLGAGVLLVVPWVLGLLVLGFLRHFS